jgi:hypothetical protein
MLSRVLLIIATRLIHACHLVFRMCDAIAGDSSDQTLVQSVDCFYNLCKAMHVCILTLRSHVTAALLLLYSILLAKMD